MTQSFIWALLGFFVLFEALHMWLTISLINRLMSRNYYDYSITNASAKSMVEEAKEKPMGPHVVDPFEGQDLGSLTGIV